MPVEHQARPAARALADAEHVGAAVLDLLPLHAQAHLEERLAHELGHRLLVAGEARRVDRAARPLDEPVAVDRERRAHARTRGRTFSPNRRICSCRFAPQSSSMTCVQPAALYSSIAATQSSGVPAMGLQRSRMESVTLAFAARRPPSSIATATGRISSGSILREVEQRVGRALDVLHLVGEVHPGDLARAVAARVAIGRVDRGDDGAADVDRGRVATRLLGADAHVAERVAHEVGRRDGRRQQAVADLAAELLHQRRGAGHVDRDVPARHVRIRRERRDVGREDLAVVLEALAAEDAAQDLDRVAHRRERLRDLGRAALLGVVEEDLGRAEAGDEAAGPGCLLHEARVHGDLHRVARVGRDDPPADRQPLRLAGDDPGQHGRGLGLHAVLAPPGIGLGEPDRVEPGLVHDAGRLEHLLQRLHRQLHHADAERNGHAGSFELLLERGHDAPRPAG